MTGTDILIEQPQATTDFAATQRLWSRLAPPLATFKRLMATADRQALRPEGLPTGTAEKIHLAVRGFEELLLDVIGDGAPDEPAAKAAAGERVWQEVLPYLLLSDHAERWYAKPRGYAGDYLTIAQIYQDRATGVGRLGPVLDRGFLELPAARAVKNRRGLVAGEIRRTVATAGRRPARVTSMACGPAQEIRDVFDAGAWTGALHVTLIDQDQQALDHVAAHLAVPYLAGQVDLVRCNLIPLATGRREPPATDQDLVYSIGLIDYFPDRLVVGLMNLAHRMLRPGGRLILGNFHPRNPSKALMDHVLQWRLIHRTEADLDRLLRASEFGRPATRFRYESQRINLFAECARA